MMMDENRSMVQAQPASVAMSTISADQYGHIEARIRADAQVRTMLAIARPRDLDVVRERLLRDAARPGFAAVSQYSIPRGGKSISGPSIRFAEAALRALGNTIVEITILHEDDTERVGEVTVGDLESNQIYRQGFRVPKVAERRRLPQGARNEDVAGTRIGADGQTLYLVRLGDADVLMAQGAITSRIIRTLALRLAPGDIVEEALDRCAATLRSQDAQDPAAARRRIADAFSAIGVGIVDLKGHLGHPLDQCSPAELDDLRGLYAAIREGHTTWAEVHAQTDASTPAADATARAAAAVRGRLSDSRPARLEGLIHLAPGSSREVVDRTAIEAAATAGQAVEPRQWTEDQWRAAEDAVRGIAQEVK